MIMHGPINDYADRIDYYADISLMIMRGPIPCSMGVNLFARRMSDVSGAGSRGPLPRGSVVVPWWFR